LFLVEVSASDFETHALSSTLTEALWFRQEGHPELKCNSALIKSGSKIWWNKNGLKLKVY